MIQCVSSSGNAQAQQSDRAGCFLRLPGLPGIDPRSRSCIYVILEMKDSVTSNDDVVLNQTLDLVRSRQLSFSSCF